VSGTLYCEQSTLKSCIAGGGGDAGCHKKACDGGGTGYYNVNTDLARQGLNGDSYLNMGKRTTTGIGYVMWADLTYAKARTVLRLKELAKRVYRRTGFPLYITDLSKNGGGWNAAHATHEHGDDIDIGIMGNTPTKIVSYYDQAGHNLNASKVLIEEALNMGGVQGIYFNDARIYKYNSNVSYVPGHRDHMHINWWGK
jgi:hypothetical protein